MKKLDVKNLTVRSVPLMCKAIIEKVNELVEKLEDLDKMIDSLGMEGADDNGKKKKVVQSKARSTKSTKPKDKPDV